MDRGPRALKCSYCITPKSSLRTVLPRTCEECGDPYKGKTRKYCTPFCRNTANNRAKQERAGTLTVGEKLCLGCDQTRPAHMFNMDVTKVDDLHSRCRVCQAKKHAAWRETHKDYGRAGNLMTNFGLTIEEYEFLFEFQGGKCALCRRTWNPDRQRFHVEHDHHTGAIRSLSCFDCNKNKIGKLTLEDALALVEYFRNPTADRAFGRRRFVPAGMEKGPRKRKKRARR